MATKTVSKWRQDKELAKISTSRKRPLEIEDTPQSKACRLDVKIEPENEEESAQMTFITETEVKREINENNNRQGLEYTVYAHFFVPKFPTVVTRRSLYHESSNVALKNKDLKSALTRGRTESCSSISSCKSTISLPDSISSFATTITDQDTVPKMLNYKVADNQVEIGHNLVVTFFRLMFAINAS